MNVETVAYGSSRDIQSGMNLGESLVRPQVKRVDIVEVDRSSWNGHFKRFRQIAFPETLEFGVVTFWTLEVEPCLSNFGFFFTYDPISAALSTALENVGLRRDPMILGFSTWSVWCDS
jgi:hypothetical protein